MNETRTLNIAAYGIPMGKLAKIASDLFAQMLLNAKLCVISWIARKRLWFAVPPMAYAIRMNFHERGCVSRR